MKRIYSLLLVVGVAIAAAATAYWLGWRQGGEFSTVFTSTAQATEALMYLRAIEEGKIDYYTVVMESDIDSALFLNYYLEESAAFRFLPLAWGSDIEASRREYLTRLANYRKQHPSPQRPEALRALREHLSESERKQVPEITPVLWESMLETQGFIDAMVDRYVTKPARSQ